MPRTERNGTTTSKAISHDRADVNVSLSSTSSLQVIYRVPTKTSLARNLKISAQGYFSFRLEESGFLSGTCAIIDFPYRSVIIARAIIESRFACASGFHGIASKKKPEMKSDRQHGDDNMLAAGRRFRGDAFGATSFGERCPGGRASSSPP